MRDWNVLVRERFSGRGLTELQQTEVVSELAAHLEDLCEHERSLGITEAESISRALNEVDNWRQLSRDISRTRKPEGQMNYRTKSLWLPGLASLSTAAIALSIVNHSGVQPKLVWYGPMVGLELYFPWLMMLPLFGALAAYLSRRAHGEVQARLAAALSPVIFLFGVFCTLLMFTGMIERHVHWRALPVMFGLTILNWVLIPGAALLLGALPFLRSSPMREAEHTSS